MGIIAFIILGLLAGIIAKALMPGRDPGGIIVTALIGIAGALLGGFLAARLGGVDGQPARRNSVHLVFCDGAEIARALENGDFVVIIRPIHRAVDAEAGKAEIDVVRRRLHASVREQVLGIDQWLRPAVGNKKDVDAILVEETAMEELDLERHAGAAPERFVRNEAQIAILVVA